MKILPHANDIVAVVTNLLLKEAENRDKVFAVRVRIDIDDHDAEDPAPTVMGFVSLAVVPTAYRQIYCAFSDRPKAYLECSWRLVCSHDSAWRDDGIRSTLKAAYTTLLRQAEKRFGKDAAVLSIHIAIDDMAIKPAEAILNPTIVNNEIGAMEFVLG